MKAKLKEMKEKHNIFLSSKWHRTSFTPALTISQKTIEQVLECFIKTFKTIGNNWKSFNKKSIKIKPMY